MNHTFYFQTSPFVHETSQMDYNLINLSVHGDHAYCILLYTQELQMLYF